MKDLKLVLRQKYLNISSDRNVIKWKKKVSYNKFHIITVTFKNVDKVNPAFQ